jgi:hypothetical protein
MTDTDRFNRAQMNTAALGEAERGTTVNVGNANRNLTAATANAGAENTRATNQAGIESTHTITNADRLTNAATTNAAAANRRQETKAELDTRVDTQNADRGVKVAEGNRDAGLTSNAQEINRQAGLRSSAQGAVSTEGDLALGKAKTDADSASRRSGLVGGVLNTGGQALALLTSDRRVKTDVERESDADVDDFLSALEAYAYRYKGESPQSPERHGVMAQDLEKSRIGRGLVHDSPWGKQVDTAGLTMALAGAVARKLRRA